MEKKGTTLLYSPETCPDKKKKRGKRTDKTLHMSPIYFEKERGKNRHESRQSLSLLKEER